VTLSPGEGVPDDRRSAGVDATGPRGGFDRVGWGVTRSGAGGLRPSQFYGWQ